VSPTPTPTPAPLTIGVASLANGKLRSAYFAPIMIGGGKPPYNSFVAGGSLPPGTSLGASTGIIAGIPLGAGTYSFAITATDSAASSVSKNISITITK
jgi:large repetitive protein